MAFSFSEKIWKVNLKYVSEKIVDLYFHMTLRDQFGRNCDKLEGCV